MTYEEALIWLRKVGGRVERDDWESGAFECVAYAGQAEPARFFLEDAPNEEAKRKVILKAIEAVKKNFEA